MPESLQAELDYVRKPRVHIKYDVETDGAVVERALPFVVGVLGDYTGTAKGPGNRLEDRKFVNIDRDNFDAVMSQLGAELQIRVKNTLTGEGELPVNLKFDAMSDFAPGRIVDQVEPLKKLLDARNQLSELLSQVDRSPELEEKLEKLLADGENVKSVAGELGTDNTEEEGGDA